MKCPVCTSDWPVSVSPVWGTPGSCARDLWVCGCGRAVCVSLQLHAPAADGTWRESEDGSAHPEDSAPVDPTKAVSAGAGWMKDWTSTVLPTETESKGYSQLENLIFIAWSFLLKLWFAEKVKIGFHKVWWWCIHLHPSNKSLLKFS